MQTGLITLAGDSDLPRDELRLDGFPEAKIAQLWNSPGTFALDRGLRQGAGLATLWAQGSRSQMRSAASLGTACGGSRRHSDCSAVDTDQARDGFAEMVSRHNARWQSQDKPGVVAGPHIAGFERDLFETFVTAGKTPPRCECAGEVAFGCDDRFIERRRVLGYQCGLARFGDE